MIHPKLPALRAFVARWAVLASSGVALLGAAPDDVPKPLCTIDTEDLKHMCLHPGDDAVVTASAYTNPGEIHVYDRQTMKRLAKFALPHDEAGCVACSPDGKRIAAGGLGVDSVLGLWDAASGEEKKTWEAHKYGVDALAFSPDGKTLASGGGFKTICLWSVPEGDKKRQLEANVDNVHCLAFSPAGDLLASGGYKGTVLVYDVASGKLKGPLTGFRDAVRAVTFDAKGKKLFAGSIDGTLQVYSTETWEVTSSVKAHPNGVFCLAVSPDGKLLATGGSNCATDCKHGGEVLLWSLPDLTRLTSFRAHELPVIDAQFSHDNKLLVTAGGKEAMTDTGAVKVWDVTSLLKSGK